MPDAPAAFLAHVNDTRYQGQSRGHYESFFLRANHPTRPLAFWIRYTLFSPKAQPDQALGELWAIVFDGQANQHVALKQEFPLSQCDFSRSGFQVQVGEARLDAHHLHGSLHGRDHAIAWELEYLGGSDPLLLLPFGLYTRKFPAAKNLVAQPMARFSGTLTVDGTTQAIADWAGSQNHNWGTRHTDRYAWGQVAGFDTHPDSFLEVATARMRLGPLWTPPLTPIVLRHRGQEYALNQLSQTVRAQGAFDYFTWRFRSQTPRVAIEGLITAPRAAFAGLTYLNPPGGTKHCLNTKLASCRVRVRDRELDIDETLETASRAAFEILTDDRDHGVPIVV